jgi:carboxylesterase type B
MKDYPWTDLDRKIADTLVTYWTSFTKAANPNGTGLVNWPAYNPRNEYWLNIGDTIRMECFNPTSAPPLTVGIGFGRISIHAAMQLLRFQ